ncbi:hypothetical protein QBC32DRAFT_376598 [Pseudoneurospora amorphoporcata]|uniref:CCHC-type domain-containing protein n=1 Tax=Pseudoneurospora amorphoporcata TaxID=241081 RepID=A0AAN6NSP0_9PEZI|nr:hypothetical protein QBC32DRAFT_376598 [Pseudoneurospora amorphoporcata]
MASIPWSQNANERHELATLKAGESSSQPKPVLSHLDKFSGDKKDLDTWIYTAESKLHVDGRAISDLEAQFYYLYSSLSPSVRRTLFAFAQSSPANWTPAQLLEKLRVNYGEVNQDKKAGLELLSLKQKSRESISSFLVRFEEVLYRAKANTWPDQALINSLMSSLNNEWLRRLQEKPEYPDSYSDLCSYLRKLDANTFLGSSAPANHGAAYENGGEPMHIDATRVRPGGSRIGPSKEQRNAWKKQGKCAACGSPDHWARECPNKKKKVQIRYIRVEEPVGGPKEDDEIYDDEED